MWLHRSLHHLHRSVSGTITVSREWYFHRTEDGLWFWERVESDGAKVSARCYAGFVECLADAIRHGYEPSFSALPSVWTHG